MSFESAATSLTQGDIERFSRQMLVEGVGAEGMERIRRSCVLCVGAGGLGSTCIVYLAAAGVGKIIVADGDQVDRSNLHRQVIHSVDSIGINKARSAKEACQRINPFTVVEVVSQMLTPFNVEAIMRRCDVVVDGTDNVAARYIINDAAMRCELPVVSGSAMRWEGQLAVYGYHGGPCYRCLFPDPPPPEAVGSCNDTGVLGPVPGMIGCLQAMETLKILCGSGSPLSGKMFIFNGLHFTTKVVKLRARQESCSGCGPEAMAYMSLTEAMGVHPEYNATSCGGNCVAPTALPASQRCSPSFLVSMRNENESMLQEALTSVRQLSDWCLCLDVRAANQYEMVHLPGAVSLPYDTLLQWNREDALLERWMDFLVSALMLDIMRHSQLEDVSALLPPRCTVYVVCRRGINSVKAVQLLSEKAAADNSDRLIDCQLKNIDGGLNMFHSNVDPTFPFY